MSRAQEITEIFSGSGTLPIKKVQNRDRVTTYLYKTTVNGHLLEVFLDYDIRSNEVEISWFRDDTSERKGDVSQQEIFRVLSIIFTILRQVLKEQDVETVNFYAASTDPKKVKIYKMLADKIARDYDGHVYVKDAGYKIVYNISIHNPYTPEGYF